MSSPFLGTQGTAIPNSSSDFIRTWSLPQLQTPTRGSGGCILALLVLEWDQTGQKQRPMRSTHQSAAPYFRSNFRDSSLKTPLPPLGVLKSKVTRPACHSFGEGTLHLGSQQPTQGLTFATDQSASLEPEGKQRPVRTCGQDVGHGAHHCCR